MTKKIRFLMTANTSITIFVTLYVGTACTRK
jgi:hypothetical protein